MKNKSLIYLAGLGVLAGLGYFGYKAWRKKHPKNETPPPPPPTITDGGTTPSGGTTPPVTPSGGTTPSNYTTNPFKTKDELLAFQNYVINTKKDSSILGSAGADGFWGQKSASAWDKYGKEYLTNSNSETENLTINQKYAKLPASVQRDYWNVVKDPAYTGAKDKNYLIEILYDNSEFHPGYTARNYIHDWSNTLDKYNASTNKQKYTWFRDRDWIYDIFDGFVMLAPFDKKAYVNGSAKLYSDPKLNDVSTTAPQLDKKYLGIIKNVVFIKNNKNSRTAFLFIPGGNYQWALRDNVTY